MGLKGFSHQTSWGAIATAIATATGQEFAIARTIAVGGGSINQSYRVEGGDLHYFVKLNAPHQRAMFEAEAMGLKAMAATHTIKIPQVITQGVTDSHSYLVLEWLNLGGSSGQGWHTMGCQLALMHREGKETRFGFDLNNTIGSTPQRNEWSESWPKFFARDRIGYQISLAKKRGGAFPEPRQVMAAVEALLAHHQPSPSLVHGDLWSGNAAITREGEPVILDPAVYYGDREVDLAMTELFGGFPAAFYQGYESIWPLDSGYRDRKILYNLYHILNHFNLFGGGYEGQAQTMLHQIL